MLVSLNCNRLVNATDTLTSLSARLPAGAFGSCPKPVMEASHAWSVKAEENPDLFRRFTYPTQLRSILRRLSSERLPHCPASTLALIRNATTGTNAVLRGIPWQEGDHILCLSTVYGALDRTIDYIIEHSATSGTPKPTKVTMEVTYPISHEELLKTFTAKLSALRSEGKRVRLATFDAVSSHPGVLLPWERLCVLCREHNVLSLVDAAHAFGQIDCSLLGSSAAPADFWVSNVHKWSFAPRGCAIFYVPAQNRHFVPSTLPTSWGWKAKASSSLATPGVAADEEWAAAWRDPGTDQVSHYLSVDAALDFVRDRLGGEERVRRYNTSLARIGGAEVARILGTEILDVEGKEEERLTACMVTVRLPLVSRAIGPDATKWVWQMGGEGFFFETLQDDFATNIPILAHNNRVYARLSAQVWLDVDDFAYAGRALKEVCRRVNEGDMPAAKASVGAEAAGQPVEAA
ncbi:PLP-dependent transferase [Jaminaea rosea]|uniref:PLP-dependent transferase n=1 Tax=Jaminaea rosea TaxID=1569628 RepID=A0A316UKP5_9BASI|nr:PLP-dependent transferase [Jaminaea rosea]PWN25504.1 PLP-dependent transferase [Jaminaea rosea]